MPLTFDLSKDGKIELRGSFQDLLQLSEYVGDPNISRPRESFANIRIKDGEKLKLDKDGSTLVIQGSKKHREIFAENLKFLAHQKHSGGIIPHLHIEYVPDSYDIDKASRPAIIYRDDEANESE